jgi:hypothetical protein
MNTKLYTGTGSTNAQTGVGFQPDWLWLKSRSQAVNHYVFDAVRGVTKGITTNTTSAESTKDSSWVTSFDSDGFSLGSEANINTSSATYASWNWKANGAGSANTDGDIASTVSVNQTAGFSISKYTATGSNATVGHGLGAVPKMIIIKDLEDSGGSNWAVYHNSIGNTKFLELNTTAASDTSSGLWNNTTPTSGVFSIGTNSRVNNSGNDFIAYCFAEKTGYSKFGSFTGIDADDNTFVYCGFAPSWIMFKRTDSTNSWGIFDNKRDALNPNQAVLDAENNNAASSGADVDFLSNGFKIRSASGLNGDGEYIYMAFGQSIVGTNNVPCTAR